MLRQSSLWTAVLISVLLVVGVLVSAGQSAAADSEDLNNAQEATLLAPRAQPLTVAVLSFQCRDEQIAGTIADMVMGALSGDPAIDLVEREQLDKVLQEYQIGLSGLVSASQAQRIGFLVGAKALVMGRVFLVDQQILITGKVVGVETGRVYVEQVRGEQTGQLLSLAETLGSKIAATVKLNRDKLCAPDIAKDKEQRMAELAERLEGKQLPTVSISIPERHYGQPVIDPAVETELMYWFNKCGFTVIDPGDAKNNLADWAYRYYHPQDDGSQTQPLGQLVGADVDVVIVGEAFSEFATRIGPLTSCKVRAEVRALERGTGRVLAVCRRSQTAVDISERIAGKTGLQQAGVNIAYELIQQLVPVEIGTE